MLFLLSPAKSLDYDTPVPESLPHTRPQFVPQSTALIEVLREKSVQEIASLMALSDTLAALNVARYQVWKPQFTAPHSTFVIPRQRSSLSRRRLVALHRLLPVRAHLQ